MASFQGPPSPVFDYGVGFLALGYQGGLELWLPVHTWFRSLA